MRKLVKLFLSLSLCCISLTAHGWGFQGHEYTGQVAWESLSEEERVWVSELLELVDEPSLSEVTTWADRMRGTPIGRSMSRLHYANVPRHDHHFNYERDCRSMECVVGAAYNDLEVLMAPESNRQEKAEALRTLSHWLTDMHQPLHLGYADDRGGNDVRVQYRDFETNLHSLWDTVLVRDMNLLSPQDAAQLNLDSGITHPWREQLVHWANESANEVESTVYSFDMEAGAVTDEYVERAKPIIQQRLALAGQRLAVVIKAAYRAN